MVISGPESHLFPTVFGPLVELGCGSEGRAAVLANHDQASTGDLGGGDIGPHFFVSRDRLAGVIDAAAAQGVADPVARAGSVVDQVLRAYLAEQGGTADHRLIEKTPQHVFYAHRILALWGQARIIELVRDGRDVVASLAARSRSADWAPAEREAQIDRWVRAVEFGRDRRASRLASGRWMTVRYEDLVDDPIPAIANLFDFIEVDASEEFITTVAENTAFANIPPHMVGEGRHHFRGRPGGWRDEFDQADAELFEARGGDLLRALGYGD